MDAEEAKSNATEDDRLQGPSATVRENDVVLLVFADGRQLFAQCIRGNKRGPFIGQLKINKTQYATSTLIGLCYGTVLEVDKKKLRVLPPTEDIIPSFPTGDDNTASAFDAPSNDQARDNRGILDDNTSQGLDHAKLAEMRKTATCGSEIVKTLIENSSTFSQKTDFAQAKYIKRKQLKYQLRCRLTRCTAATVCEALYVKDAKKIMNLRQDTLGQILSYANISAGAQVLVWESVWGLITGAVAERLGGYGRVFSVYSTNTPAHNEFVERFNLSFRELSSIKWVHSGDVYKDSKDFDEDKEAQDRDALEWPCPLQSHTRDWLRQMKTTKEQREFCAKRSARFARKLTRHTPDEAKKWLDSRRCDSLIIAVKTYDTAETLLALLHHLSPSCPFVLFSEFIEPLTAAFRAIQPFAINLRLSDTWAREYQVLPGRTHPKMDMSQSGGFILTGIKLDEEQGFNELDEDLRQEIREKIGGFRARNGRKKGRAKGKDGKDEEPASKRQRKSETNQGTS